MLLDQLLQDGDPGRLPLPLFGMFSAEAFPILRHPLLNRVKGRDLGALTGSVVLPARAEVVRPSPTTP